MTHTDALTRCAVRACPARRRGAVGGSAWLCALHTTEASEATAVDRAAAEMAALMRSEVPARAANATAATKGRS